MGMVGPEQGETLLSDLKPLAHSKALFRSTQAASDLHFSPE